MTLNEFCQYYDGKYVDFDGVYGAQCTDIIKYWVQNIGSPLTHGNAIDYKENWQLGGYVWVDNTPSGVPRPGDIVVWGMKPYGHVAIFLSGNNQAFDSFDQNFPVGSPCHYQHHTYTNVKGWLHPMVLDAAQPPVNPPQPPSPPPPPEQPPVVPPIEPIEPPVEPPVVPPIENPVPPIVAPPRTIWQIIWEFIISLFKKGE